ncbi:MAG: hypothetical protein J6R82_04995 [Clostridia bacterium]|nr:hypothetical protein [Clostridia bacterium]
MIQFYGKISPTCAGKALLLRAREEGTVWLWISAVVAAIAALLFCFGHSISLLASISLSMLALSVICCANGIRLKVLSKRSSIDCKVYDITDIVFEDSWITYEEIELDRSFTFHISDIRKALDLDDCYLLLMGNPNVQCIVCQKSLLVEGELDEFEELIADKLK